MAGDLNPKQHAFCVEYLKDRNATRAAISAGYSAKTAQSIGCQLLKHPHVAREIARLTDRIEKKSELTAERVMQELSNLAFFDPASMYGADGKLLAITDMPEATRRAITAIDGDKIKAASKLGSLELAAKILQMVKADQQTQQAIQIIIQQPPELPAPGVAVSQLLPEWD